MSAPALPVTLYQALQSLDPEYETVTVARQFVESLGDIMPTVCNGSLSPKQSERLEAAYQAGAKCLDNEGLLLVISRDALLHLTAPPPPPPVPVTKGTFDAIVQAMLAVVREYRHSTIRPPWVDDLLITVGGPAQLAKMGHQAVKDAVDAELWRFMLASINDSTEAQIMEKLSESFALDMEDPAQARAQFEAHVRAGLAEFKRLPV